MEQTSHNRQYKDSVFVDLFSNDQSARDNFLSLYNALHKTQLDPSTEIHPVRLEQVMYMNFYNDVSCLVDNKIIVLAEHQSTVNENMPLRFLEYITRLYEQILSVQDRYARKLKKIPTPEFYVFYNGLEDFPISKTLKLSDAFLVSPETAPLELTVQVFNINHSKHNEVLERCKPLHEYSVFVEMVRTHLERDKENGFTNAIKECLKNNVLKDYLQRKSKEVMNMLIAEYSYETDIEVQRQEALDEGIEQGIEQGIVQGIEQGIEQGEYKKALDDARKALSLGITPAIIAQITGLSLEDIERL